MTLPAWPTGADLRDLMALTWKPVDNQAIRNADITLKRMALTWEHLAHRLRVMHTTRPLNPADEQDVAAVLLHMSYAFLLLGDADAALHRRQHQTAA